MMLSVLRGAIDRCARIAKQNRLAQLASDIVLVRRCALAGLAGPPGGGEATATVAPVAALLGVFDLITSLNSCTLTTRI